LRQAGLTNQVNLIEILVEKDLTVANTLRQRSNDLPLDPLPSQSALSVDSLEYVPKPPLPGHFTEPPYEKLQKMSR
jgi:hypothetical protein